MLEKQGDMAGAIEFAQRAGDELSPVSPVRSRIIRGSAPSLQPGVGVKQVLR